MNTITTALPFLSITPETLSKGLKKYDDGSLKIAADNWQSAKNKKIDDII